MKKILVLIMTVVFAAPLSAQLKTDLFLNATPPATLTEWGNRKEVLMLMVTGQPGLPPMKFIIKTEIKTTDGTVIGYTDLARAATYVSSAAGTPTLLYANDVIPLEIMVFTGKYKSSLQKSGKLPSDNYFLCVQLVRPVDFTPVSQPVTCKSFYVAATQLPILMKPYNEQVLEGEVAQTAITFRWTPALPRTNNPVTYRLQIFEVLDRQTPVQALRSNQPLLDQEVKGTTQYIWRPQLSFIDGDVKDDEKNIDTSKAGHGKMFIWTVQTLDDHGNPVTQTEGSGEARSEPSVFTVKMKVKGKGNR